MQFWNELEGRRIEDGYPLHQLLRSEGRTAWFETDVQDGDTLPAIISLTESLTDEDEVVARLQAAQNLKHPDLLEIRKIGKASLDQTLFVYAVMEPADQNLSDILKIQPLSKDEARQVAETLAGALTAIHEKGLAHGRVEPSSVLGVGDSVKLRSDCLQSPGATRAGDVAGIGATLFEAFTQRKAGSADDAQINRIPAPFGEIVRNSLNARWGLPQVAAALRPPVPAPLTTPVTSISAPMPAPTAPTGVRVSSSQSITQPPGSSANNPTKTPSAGLEKVLPPAEDSVVDSDLEAPKTNSRVAIYIALAAVALLFLIWLLAKPQRPQTAPVPNQAASPIVPTPAVPLPTPKTSDKPSAKPSAAKPHSSSAKPAPLPAETALKSNTAEPGAVWRVVAYTYHHEDQAQHKADELNHAHPDLHATVFNPAGDPNHFLVVLGGGMDKHDAFAMRDSAVHSGLAADTYVQNYQQ